MERNFYYEEQHCGTDNAYVAPVAREICVSAKSRTMALNSSRTEGYEEEEGEW